MQELNDLANLVSQYSGLITSVGAGVGAGLISGFYASLRKQPGSNLSVFVASGVAAQSFFNSIDTRLEYVNPIVTAAAHVGMPIVEGVLSGLVCTLVSRAIYCISSSGKITRE